MTFKTYHGFQELEGPLLDAEADTDSVMVSFFEEQYLRTNDILILLIETEFSMGKYKRNLISERESLPPDSKDTSIF